MSIEKELLNYKENTSISRESLVERIRRDKPDYKDSSVRWVLYRLVHDGVITKVDSEFFRIGRVKPYVPKPGGIIKKQIVKVLKSELPAIKAVVYESTILNEWVNHLIARNVLFVEVEKDYMHSVFWELQEKIQTTILLKPGIDDYYLYASDATIIVSNLISQAPLHKDSYDIRIEKLLVDIYANELLKEFISDDEIENILNDIFSTYVVNVKTVLAYAKRRKLEAKMRVVLEGIFSAKDVR
jgi:predicted transcriptional regulator